MKATLSAKVYKRAVRKGLTMHTCDICLKCFQKPSQLIRHRRIHTGEKPFKVSDCAISQKLYMLSDKPLITLKSEISAMFMFNYYNINWYQII